MTHKEAFERSKKAAAGMVKLAKRRNNEETASALEALIDIMTILGTKVENS